jgi:hypothetical protein
MPIVVGTTHLHIDTVIPPQRTLSTRYDPKSFPAPEHLYTPLSPSINDTKNIYNCVSMSFFLSYRHSIALSILEVAVKYRDPTEFSDWSWIPKNAFYGWLRDC